MDVPDRAGSTPASPPSSAQRGGSRMREESAESPGEPASVPGLLKAVWRQIQEDDVFNLAGGVAYFAFLSFPPTILVLFALTGFFGGEEVANWLTEQLGRVLPEAAEGLVLQFVNDVVYQDAAGPFSIGLLLALWAASNVFVALARALNTAYDIEEGRSWIKLRAIAVGVMLLFVLFFLSASAALIAGPQIAQALDLWGAAEVAWNVLQVPLAMLLVVAAFWACYYILPARDQAAAKMETLQGAVVATVLWLLATLGFRLYVSNFAAYTDTYGFVGAFIVLLLWLYLTGLVLLIGGELAAALEGRTRR